MLTSRLLRSTAALTAAAALTVSLAACSDDSGPQATDHPVVVASTDVWASVARAVAGDDAQVSALFDTPGGDPHEFEPTTADAASVMDANVIVMNGGHYDAYMESIAAEADGIAVTALGDHEGHDHDGDDHAGHDHEHGAQEHAFYTLPVVADTAENIADALAEVAPVHADVYHANADAFTARIDELIERMHALGAAHPNTKVAATEPLATTLLQEAGIVDIAPSGFANAVEEGQSPSAADRARFDDVLRSHEAAALIYNVQSVDPATEAVLKTARSANVPVVEFTESLPEGVTDYLAWQSEQISALEKALNA